MGRIETEVTEVDHFIFDNLDFDSDGQESFYRYPEVRKGMLEFAKMHVKRALEAATESARTLPTEVYNQSAGEYEYPLQINKESILNAYPETNIQ